MSDFPSVNNRPPTLPSYMNDRGEFQKGQGISPKMMQLLRDISVIVNADRSSRTPNTSGPAMNGEPGKLNGATGTPMLDFPGDTKGLEADLTKLLLYLKMDGENRQAQMSQDRIDKMQTEMESRHADQREALQKTLDEMDKAAHMSIFMKVFGWLMAAVAVAFAVVSCIATGGIATGAIVGAVMAIGMAAANQVGAIEKLTEKLAKALQDAGMSEKGAKILAAAIIAVGTIVATLVTGYAAGKLVDGVMKMVSATAKAGAAAVGTAGATANAVTQSSSIITESMMETAKQIQGWMKIGMGVMGAGGTAMGGLAAYIGYQSGMAQADLSEMEKFLAILRQRMEESEEELNAIMEMIQNSVAAIIDVLDHATDANLEIGRQMGMMV